MKPIVTFGSCGYAEVGRSAFVSDLVGHPHCTGIPVARTTEVLSVRWVNGEVEEFETRNTIYRKREAA